MLFRCHSNLGLKCPIEGQVDILGRHRKGMTVDDLKRVPLPIDIDVLFELSQVEFEVDPLHLLLDVLVRQVEVIDRIRDVLAETSIDLLV